MTIAANSYAEYIRRLVGSPPIAGATRTIETPSVEPTLDGYRTGCATEGLIGAKTRLGQSTTPTRVAQFNTAGVWIQTSILSDHTWVHYSISGDTIYVLNSGTWSAGPPALRAGGSSTG